MQEQKLSVKKPTSEIHPDSKSESKPKEKKICVDDDKNSSVLVTHSLDGLETFASESVVRQARKKALEMANEKEQRKHPPAKMVSSIKQLKLQNELVNACELGDEKRVKRLLKQGAKPDKSNARSIQPLGAAIWAMCPSIVNLLLEKMEGVLPMTWEGYVAHNRRYYNNAVFIIPCFDPGSYTRWYELLKKMERSPFIQSYHLKIAQETWNDINNWKNLRDYVLGKREGFFSVFISDLVGRSIIWLSTEKGLDGYRTQIKRAIEAASQCQTKLEQQKEVLQDGLIFACELGDTKVTLAWLEKGAKPDIANTQGKEPLGAAIWGMNIEVVNELLKKMNRVSLKTWKYYEAHNRKYYDDEVFIMLRFDPGSYTRWYALLIKMEQSPFIRSYHLKIAQETWNDINNWENLKDYVLGKREGLLSVFISDLENRSTIWSSTEKGLDDYRTQIKRKIIEAASSRAKPAQLNSTGQMVLDFTIAYQDLEMQEPPLGQGKFGAVTSPSLQTSGNTSLPTQPVETELRQQLLFSQQRQLLDAFLINMQKMVQRTAALYVPADQRRIITEPQVFLSYAWEAEGTRLKRLQETFLRDTLAKDLRRVGLNPWLDIERMVGDMDGQMRDNVNDSQFVILIGTQCYAERTQTQKCGLLQLPLGSFKDKDSVQHLPIPYNTFYLRVDNQLFYISDKAKNQYKDIELAHKDDIPTFDRALHLTATLTEPRSKQLTLKELAKITQITHHERRTNVRKEFEFTLEQAKKSNDFLLPLLLEGEWGTTFPEISKYYLVFDSRTWFSLGQGWLFFEQYIHGLTQLSPLGILPAVLGMSRLNDYPEYRKVLREEYETLYRNLVLELQRLTPCTGNKSSMGSSSSSVSNTSSSSSQNTLIDMTKPLILSSTESTKLHIDSKDDKKNQSFSFANTQQDKKGMHDKEVKEHKYANSTQPLSESPPISTPSKYVASLIQKGVPIDQLDEYGRSFLHHALVSKDIDLVQALLKHGARIDLPDKKGVTPLDVALNLGSSGEPLVALLLDAHKPSFVTTSPQLSEYARLLQATIQWGLGAEQEMVQRSLRESKWEPSSAAKALEAYAATWGYTCHDTQKDGNCFYHTISHQLQQQLGILIPYDTLRAIATHHVLEHMELYSGGVDQSMHTFIDKMSRDKTWADQIHLLALSRALNLTLVIVRSDKKINVLRRSNAILYLGYEVGLHYQSLTPQTPTLCAKLKTERVDKAYMDTCFRGGLSLIALKKLGQPLVLISASVSPSIATSMTTPQEDKKRTHPPGSGSTAGLFPHTASRQAFQQKFQQLCEENGYTFSVS